MLEAYTYASLHAFSQISIYSKVSSLIPTETTEKQVEVQNCTKLMTHNISAHESTSFLQRVSTKFLQLPLTVHHQIRDPSLATAKW